MTFLIGAFLHLVPWRPSLATSNNNIEEHLIFMTQEQRVEKKLQQFYFLGGPYKFFNCMNQQLFTQEQPRVK